VPLTVSSARHLSAAAVRRPFGEFRFFLRSSKIPSDAKTRLVERFPGRSGKRSGCWSCYRGRGWRSPESATTFNARITRLASRTRVPESDGVIIVTKRFSSTMMYP